MNHEEHGGVEEWNHKVNQSSPDNLVSYGNFGAGGLQSAESEPFIAIRVQIFELQAESSVRALGRGDRHAMRSPTWVPRDDARVGAGLRSGRLDGIVGQRLCRG